MEDATTTGPVGLWTLLSLLSVAREGIYPGATLVCSAEDQPSGLRLLWPGSQPSIPSFPGSSWPVQREGIGPDRPELLNLEFEDAARPSAGQNRKRLWLGLCAEPPRKEATVLGHTRSSHAAASSLAGTASSRPSSLSLGFSLVPSLHTSVTLCTDLDLPQTQRRTQNWSISVGALGRATGSWRPRRVVTIGRESVEPHMSLWPSGHTLDPHSRIVEGAGERG